MPIRIPPGETIVQDKRLTAIALVKALAADNGPIDQLKSKVKENLKAKDAKFAESAAVLARVQPSGGGRSWTDPAKLYNLVKSKKITLAQFLSAVAVRQEPLKAFLSGEQIDAITIENMSAQGTSLVTEFKPGARICLEDLAEVLMGLIPELSEAA